MCRTFFFFFLFILTTLTQVPCNTNISFQSKRIQGSATGASAVKMLPKRTQRRLRRGYNRSPVHKRRCVSIRIRVCPGSSKAEGFSAGAIKAFLFTAASVSVPKRTRLAYVQNRQNIRKERGRCSTIRSAVDGGRLSLSLLSLPLSSLSRWR